MATHDYQLVGLERLRADPEYMIASCTPFESGESFKARLDMSNESKEALWQYCENNWDERKKATVRHHGFNNGGLPIAPVVVSIETI